MAKIYGLRRFKHIDSLDRKSLSFNMANDLPDYVATGIVKVYDMDIGEDSYTKEIVPGVKNKAMFFIAEHLDLPAVNAYMPQVRNWMRNNHRCEFFDELNDDQVEAARQRLRDSTNLEEVEEGTFKVHDAVQEEGVEEKFITIN